ncbi:MAG: CPBP family glutamic-type intramembrane protease [Vallitalea sp.]|jgi:membrane protease YdiL (CAAX protease family)|nr:CPBP family glutamic-type intramembrane protease [Vallitalea sp.]
MEIPQRLLAQNLFFVIIGNFHTWGFIKVPILLNAILWVQLILMQEVMNKKKLSNKVIFEIAASFWFSIFVGTLYYRTGNILVPMLCHGLERYLKYLFISMVLKKNTE